MARQIGDIKISGTIEGITFYRMYGQYYAREKSSLTGRRVKQDPAFRRTMQSAGRLALGSQLASKVYRALTTEKRHYALYCALKSRAIGALKAGQGEERTVALLMAYLVEVGVLETKAGRERSTPFMKRPQGRRKWRRPATMRLFAVSVPLRYEVEETEGSLRWRKKGWAEPCQRYRSPDRLRHLIFKPFKKPRETVEPEGRVSFLPGAKAAVKEGEGRNIAAFEVEQKGRVGVVLDKGVDEAVRGTKGAAVGVVAYQQVVGAVMGKQECYGGQKLVVGCIYAIGGSLPFLLE